MRSIATAGVLLAATVFSVAARAEDRSVASNIDLHVGAGAGSIGIAAHAAMGAQAWFGDLFGIGAQGGFIEDDAIFGSKSHATYIEPTLSLRTSGAGNYCFATVGGGIASRTVEPSSFCLFASCSATPRPSHSDAGIDLSFSGGAAFHFGAFELSPYVRAERIVGVPTLTLNLALGGVLARGDD